MLERIEILDPRWSRPLAPARARATRCAGRRIERLGRRGKYLLWSFEGDVHLAQHLRMTGAVLCRARPRAARTRACASSSGRRAAARGAGSARGARRQAS